MFLLNIFQKAFETIQHVLHDLMDIINMGLNWPNNFVKISVFFILFSNILTVLILLTLLTNRFIVEAKTRRKIKVRMELDGLLSELLYDEWDLLSSEWKEKMESTELIIKKKYIGNRFNKNIFRTYLIELQRNFTGNASMMIDTLYRHFKLDEHSLKLLNHPSWNMRCLGLMELSIMSIKVDKNILSKLLNENNLVVAMEAEVTQLQLEKENPFRFLDEAEIEMSEWHQSRLMHVIKNISLDEIPDFSRWINHHLDTVKIFSIRMIAEYNQFQNTEKVSLLLIDQHTRVVNEALKCLSTLGNCDFNKKIIQLYPSFSWENKIEVLKTFGKLCDEDSFDFLIEQMHFLSFDIAFHAAASIVHFGPRGRDRLEIESKSCSPMLNSIINHQLNHMLNPDF